MKRIVVVLSFLVCLVLSGCADSEPVYESIDMADIKQGSSGDAVFISVTKNGISADASEVVINNFRPGARAEMTYRIHNGTAAAIRPEIYFVDYADVTDYSKADGAVKSPLYVSDWLVIPKLDDVTPGEIKDYTVAIEIPKDAKDIPDKFGFQIQVAGNTGGKVQTAIGTWWLVNMR